ncbi:MAG: N-acetylmuramic acid 6-phosphate etherase [Acidobacteria bacterium]|nr:N-acetylmuramic acid 6-phosphate etherase [Acidobacteriota bacterium]
MNSELASLETERRNRASAAIDQASTAELLQIINRQDSAVLNAVQSAIPSIASALDAIVARVRAGGRLFYIGAGTSGRLGVLDASECPPTFGVSPELVQGIMAGGESALSRATEASEDDPASGAADLLGRGFGPSDILVGIAASGRTPYVIGAIEKARAMGACTGSIVCTSQSPLAAASEFPIELPVGPEVITGSTRMKAGTATKLVLNMLSTGLMIRIGMTYGNLMVNVQPKNEKLRDRARRIVAEIAHLPRPEADTYFDLAGGDVKRAVVMARLGIDCEGARRRLEEAGGVLAGVIGKEKNG